MALPQHRCYHDQMVNKYLEDITEKSFVRVGDISALNPHQALEEAVSQTLLYKISEGLYYKGVLTRYGMTYPSHNQIIAELLIGVSYGYTGWTATNYLNLSTQVPVKTHISVVGDYPIENFNWLHVTRNDNIERQNLSILEISILEILKSYPDYVEDSWDDMVKHINTVIKENANTPKWSFSMSEFLNAAANEADIRLHTNVSKFHDDLVKLNSL